MANAMHLVNHKAGYSPLMVQFVKHPHERLGIDELLRSQVDKF
jgi:hypothetical protein